MNESLESLTTGLMQRLKDNANRLSRTAKGMALAGGLGLAAAGIAACDNTTTDVCDGPGCIQADAEYALAVPIVNDTIPLERLIVCDPGEDLGDDQGELQMHFRYNGGIPGVDAMSATIFQEDACYELKAAGPFQSIPVGMTVKMQIDDVQGTDPQAVDTYLGQTIVTTIYPKTASGDRGSYLRGRDNSAERFELNLFDTNVYSGAIFQAFQNGNVELHGEMYGQPFTTTTSRQAIVDIPADARTMETTLIEPLAEPRIEMLTFDCDTYATVDECRADYEAAKAEIVGQ